MPRMYEWDPAPPTLRQRVAAGVFSVALLVTGASYYIGWRLFGEYDKQVYIAVFFVGLLLFARWMPGVKRS